MTYFTSISQKIFQKLCTFRKVTIIYTVKQSKIWVFNVKTTVMKALIRRLHERRLNHCTNIDLTVGQASNCWLYTRWMNCYNRRIESYIDYFLKSIKIFRCPFSATNIAPEIYSFNSWTHQKLLLVAKFIWTWR